MKRSYYLKNVVTLELAKEKCIGCGMCIMVCPHAVFVLEDKKSTIVDKNACIECGACMRNCPVEALSVRAGVACASAIIKGALNKTEPVCGCADSDDKKSGCCG